MKSPVLLAAVVGMLLISCKDMQAKADAPEGAPGPDAFAGGICADAARGKAKFHVAFDRVELGKAAGPLSDLTCRRFILEDGVQGHLTLDTGGEELTPEQFYGAVIVALAAQGLVVKENGPEARISLRPYLTLKSLKSVGEEAFEVERADLDQLLVDSHYAEAMRGARATPAAKDGQPQGFKLFNVRPVSLFAQLGLKNGDVVEQINGQPITTFDQVKSAVEGLKGAAQVEVSIDRSGTNVRKVCTVK
jgi:hypothetical protein